MACELSFYQTRTILRGRFAPCTVLLNRSARRQTFRCLSTESKPNATQESVTDPPSFLREKAAKQKSKVKPSDSFGKSSTITPVERRVFNTIFSSLQCGTSQKRPALQVEDGESTDHDDILAIFEPPNDLHKASQKAGDRQYMKNPEDLDNIEAARDGISSIHFIKNYPKPLQQAARRTAHIISRRDAQRKQSGETKTAVQNPEPDVLPSLPADYANRSEGICRDSITEATEMVDHERSIEALRHTEIDQAAHPAFKYEESPHATPSTEPERITGLQDVRAAREEVVNRIVKTEMKEIGQLLDEAAKSLLLCNSAKPADVAGDRLIWDTCIQKIFPLTHLLVGAKSIAESRKARNRAESQPSREASGAMPSIRSLPSHMEQLSVVSRLYPALLLLALRLYFKHFPTSPYALALLPQMRSCGPASYILGANTHFYNTLIRLKWEVYSDLRGIDQMLGEMQSTGVQFDAGTHQILEGIVEAKWKDVGLEDRELGRDLPKHIRGFSWWERPEHAKWFQRVCVEWKQVIAARLREQGLGSLISERDYGTGSHEEKFQASQRQVLL